MCGCVAMVATDVTDARLSPYVFRSYQLPRKTHTRYQGSSRHDIWAAVRASTAAPGYFDEFVIGDKVFQDGGILVNNPTHIAVHDLILNPTTKLYSNCTVVYIGLSLFNSLSVPEKLVTLYVT